MLWQLQVGETEDMKGKETEVAHHKYACNRALLYLCPSFVPLDILAQQPKKIIYTRSFQVTKQELPSLHTQTVKSNYHMVLIFLEQNLGLFLSPSMG